MRTRAGRNTDLRPSNWPPLIIRSKHTTQRGRKRLLHDGYVICKRQKSLNAGVEDVSDRSYENVALEVHTLEAKRLPFSASFALRD